MSHFSRDFAETDVTRIRSFIGIVVHLIEHILSDLDFRAHHWVCSLPVRSLEYLQQQLYRRFS